MNAAEQMYTEISAFKIANSFVFIPLGTKTLLKKNILIEYVSEFTESMLTLIVHIFIEPNTQVNKTTYSEFLGFRS